MQKKNEWFCSYNLIHKADHSPGRKWSLISQRVFIRPYVRTKTSKSSDNHYRLAEWIIAMTPILLRIILMLFKFQRQWCFEPDPLPTTCFPPNQELTAIFNSVPNHARPLSQNLVSRTLLKHLQDPTGPDHDITVTAHPLPVSKKVKNPYNVLMIHSTNSHSHNSNNNCPYFCTSRLFKIYLKQIKRSGGNYVCWNGLTFGLADGIIYNPGLVELVYDPVICLMKEIMCVRNISILMTF